MCTISYYHCTLADNPPFVRLSFVYKYVQTSLVSVSSHLPATHSPAGELLGESQFRRLEKKLSTLSALSAAQNVVQMKKGRFENTTVVIAEKRLQLLQRNFTATRNKRDPTYFAL
jgi:hypothetical protein